MRAQINREGHLNIVAETEAEHVVLSRLWVNTDPHIANYGGEAGGLWGMMIGFRPKESPLEAAAKLVLENCPKCGPIHGHPPPCASCIQLRDALGIPLDEEDPAG